MLSRNGLGVAARLTQSSYQLAVSETVNALKGDGSERDMADAWGVSSGTVGNAINRRHDLSGLPLLKLGERFDPSALDTILALIGAKAVARDAVMVDVSAIPCDVAKVLPLLIELFADGECSTEDVRKLDQAGAIDCLGKVTDMLRQRRDDMRLRAVNG